MQLYWSFKGKALQDSKNKVNRLELLKNELIDKHQQLQQQEAASIKQGRSDTPERLNKKQQYNKLKIQLNELESKLQSYATADPLRIDTLKKATQICKESANRTGGVDIIIYWCTVLYCIVHVTDSNIYCVYIFQIMWKQQYHTSKIKLVLMTKMYVLYVIRYDWVHVMTNIFIIIYTLCIDS